MSATGDHQSVGEQLALALDSVDAVRQTPVRARIAEAGSLLALYAAAARAIIRTDTSTAWSRKQILGLALEQGLVPTPRNVPLLRVALQRLVESGDVRRVARGYYRAPADK